MLKSMKLLLDASEKVLAAACVLSFAVMFGLGVLIVVFRFIVESSLAFPDEIIRYLFVWVTALGSAIGLRRNIHAAIGLFVNALPSRSRHIALLFASLCTATFLGIIVENGWRVTVLEVTSLSPALEISMAWVYSAIPVGAAFGLLYTVEMFFTQLAVDGPGAGVPASDQIADDP